MMGFRFFLFSNGNKDDTMELVNRMLQGAIAIC